MRRLRRLVGQERCERVRGRVGRIGRLLHLRATNCHLRKGQLSCWWWRCWPTRVDLLTGTDSVDLLRHLLAFDATRMEQLALLDKVLLAGERTRERQWLTGLATRDPWGITLRNSSIEVCLVRKVLATSSLASSASAIAACIKASVVSSEFCLDSSRRLDFFRSSSVFSARHSSSAFVSSCRDSR